MKHVFTVSLEESTIEQIMEHRRKKAFPNKSRLVEEAILDYIKKNKGADDK